MERQRDVPRTPYVSHKILIRDWQDGFNCTVILIVGGAVHRVVGLLIPMDRTPTTLEYWSERDAMPYWYGYSTETEFLDMVIGLALGP